MTFAKFVAQEALRKLPGRAFRLGRNLLALAGLFLLSTGLVRWDEVNGLYVSDRPDHVIATIDGTPITEAEYAAWRNWHGEVDPVLRQSIGAYLGHGTSDLEAYIGLRLFAEAKEFRYLAEDPAVLWPIQWQKPTAMFALWYDTNQATPSTDDYQAAYDEKAATSSTAIYTEMLQIVTASQADAEALRRRVEAGEDFADLAQRYSLNDYVRETGDAWVKGYLVAPSDGESQIYVDYYDAIAALEPGEMALTVATDGNWYLHLCVVCERESAIGSLEQEWNTLHSGAHRWWMRHRIEELWAAMDVEILDENFEVDD
jgi:hypothetical protein